MIDPNSEANCLIHNCSEGYAELHCLSGKQKWGVTGGMQPMSTHTAKDSFKMALAL